MRYLNHSSSIMYQSHWNIILVKCCQIWEMKKMSILTIAKEQIKCRSHSTFGMSLTINTRHSSSILIIFRSKMLRDTRFKKRWNLSLSKWSMMSWMNHSIRKGQEACLVKLCRGRSQLNISKISGNLAKRSRIMSKPTTWCLEWP